MHIENKAPDAELGPEKLSELFTCTTGTAGQ